MAEQAEEQKQPEQQPQEQEPQEDNVVLSRSQYEAVLDRIAELEASRQPLRSEDDDIESLAQEAKARPSEQQQQFQAPYKSLEDMSNQELVSYIMQGVQKQGEAVLTEVQTLKVLREIDKASATHEDFWDYEKEVYQYAVNNPTLTIEQCYKLAKTDESKGPKKSDKTDDTKEGGRRTETEKLFGLPPRPIPGEKPSSIAAATKQGGVMSLKDAAAAAWEEATKGMKPQ